MNTEENVVRNKLNQAKKELEELHDQKSQVITDVQRLAVVKNVLESNKKKATEDDTKKRE